MKDRELREVIEYLIRNDPGGMVELELPRATEIIGMIMKDGQTGPITLIALVVKGVTLTALCSWFPLCSIGARNKIQFDKLIACRV